MSATASDLRVEAACPTRVSSRPIRAARSASSNSSLVPNAARIENSCASASNSKMEPPSVPDKLHGMGNDGREHLVQIEARIDGMADIVQSLHLLDRASELPAPQL